MSSSGASRRQGARISYQFDLVAAGLPCFGHEPAIMDPYNDEPSALRAATSLANVGRDGALDEDVAAARISLPTRLVTAPALDADDTRQWLAGHMRSGAITLLVGLVVLAASGLWARSELNEPKYSESVRTISTPDPFCGSNPPFAPATTLFPNIPGADLPCFTTRELRTLTKNSFNQLVLVPLTLGLMTVLSGLLTLRRVRRWRRIANNSEWTPATLVAVRSRRKTTPLALIEVGKPPMLAVMATKSTAWWRSPPTDASTIDMLTDDQGDWFARVGGEKHPLLMHEARSSADLKMFHDWNEWTSRQTPNTGPGGTTITPRR